MAFETSTTTFGGNVPQRAPAFSWSYSKLKNFRSCAKRHFHYDIAKDVVEEKSEALAHGDEVHHAMHLRIAKGTPLPGLLNQYEPYVQEFLKGADQPGVTLLVEQKFAIDRNYKPCGWFDKRNVWFRAIADAVKLVGNVAVNWDWKTGQPPSTKGQKDDPLQILTAAACIFAYHPQIEAIRNEFIWLDYGMKTRADLKRHQLPELWASIAPEVREYEHALATGTFPPKKNGLCRGHCGVTSCQYHGG